MFGSEKNMHHVMKAFSGAILTYWVAFLFFFVFCISIADPKFSLTDKAFFGLAYIYVGCFPAMVICISSLWRKYPRQAKFNLAFLINFGTLSYFCWPSIST